MASSMVKTIQLNADMKNFISQFLAAIKSLQNETNKIEKPSIFDQDLKDSQDVLGQLREIKEAKDELERIGAEGGNTWKKLEAGTSWNKLEEKEKILKEIEVIKDKEEDDNLLNNEDENKGIFKSFLEGFTPDIKEFFDKLKEVKNMTPQEKMKKLGERAWSGIKKIGVETFKKIGSSIKDFFLGILKDALDNMKSSLSYDSNGMNYSEEAYEQQMEYGLSDSENYALTQTLKRLNMSKDEYEMGGYNDERAKLLREQLKYNKKNYEELKSSGALEKMAQLQEDYQKAQEEMKQTLIKFIVEHGKEIMAIFRGLLNMLKAIFKVLNWVGNMIGNDGTQTAEEAREHTNQIIQSNMVTTSNKTNNININNSLTHNGAGTTTRSQLIEAGKQNGMIIQNSIKNS